MPFTIIITIISYLFIEGKLRIHQATYFSVLSIIVVGGIILIFTEIAPNTKYAKWIGSLDMITNPKIMMQYDKSNSNSEGRFQIYSDLFDNYLNDGYKATLGLGGSAITESSSLKITSARLQIIRQMPDSVKFLGSLGIIGLLFLISTLISTILFIKKYLSLESDMFFRINAYAFIPFIAVCIISLIYTSIWASQVGLILWIMLGIFVKRYLVIYHGLKNFSNIT